MYGHFEERIRRRSFQAGGVDVVDTSAGTAMRNVPQSAPFTVEASIT